MSVIVVQGAVAVACTDPTGFRERSVAAAVPQPHYILVWNFKDPIRPEYVLQAPSEVFAFQINPSMPTCVAAGCLDGRILLWDCSLLEVIPL
jgi:dynein intermediate chain 3, axonemal